MPYAVMPKFISGTPDANQVRQYGILIEYNGGNQTFLLAAPDCDLRIACLKISNNSFYEVVTSLSGYYKYYALQYNSYTGATITLNTIDFTDTENNYKRTLTTESGVLYNYQLRTQYSAPWYPTLPLYENEDLLITEYSRNESGNLYPITYHYENSVVSGPTEAAVGDTVTVSAVPDVGYGITDASTQILVTNDGVAVPYTWDAQSNQITFTMPQPVTNRGGFGSTGQ